MAFTKRTIRKILKTRKTRKTRKNNKTNQFGGAHKSAKSHNNNNKAAKFGWIIQYIEQGNVEQFFKELNDPKYLLMKSGRGSTLKEIIDFHIEKITSIIKKAGHSTKAKDTEFLHNLEIIKNNFEQFQFQNLIKCINENDYENFVQYFNIDQINLMRQTDKHRRRLMQIINEVPVPKIKEYFMQAVFGLLMYFIEHGDYDNFHNNFNYECGNTQEDINNYLLMKSSRRYTLKEIIDFHI